MDDQTKKLYERKAQIIQAVGQPIRLAIIDLLKLMVSGAFATSPKPSVPSDPTCRATCRFC